MASAKKVPCPQCGGRGIVSVSTDDVKCSTCNGAGTVKAVIR